MNYTVRKAAERDIDKILDLLSQVNLIHHNGRPDLFKAATKYTRDEVMGIINNEKTPVFVAVGEDDKVAGYAFCVFKQFVDDGMMTDIKTLYIDDLCVDENCRHSHIGSLLYAHVREFAKENGCYNVTLNVWYFNESARRFYESMGMQPQRQFMEDIL